MILPLILGVVLGAISVIFALQNVAVITVSFFAWHIEGSLALILMVTLFVGVMTALLVVLPESIKNYFRYKSLKKENLRLEEELRKQKEGTAFARNTPPTPEQIEHLEKSAIDETGTL